MTEKLALNRQVANDVFSSTPVEIIERDGKLVYKGDGDLFYEVPDFCALGIIFNPVLYALGEPGLGYSRLANVAGVHVGEYAVTLHTNKGENFHGGGRTMGEAICRAALKMKRGDQSTDLYAI